jgi:acyl transferase domain-containing protein
VPNYQTTEAAIAGTEIAVIGMAGRFAGAANLNEFWDQQEKGVEVISFFTDDQLLAAGVSAELLANPSYVRARAVLDDVERFDADFFGFTPRQAEITDPQQRVFLECAWEALENAGYDTERTDERIGVFAGASMSSYFVNLYSNPHLMKTVGGFQAMLGNDKDFLATLACYKLNLKGPGLTVQTACSTSLVAVHVACQQLLGGDCDVALAGGVSITLPQHIGYLYQEGGIHSPDGHCRVFDSQAGGTVGGNGAGLVVLKRLKDAVRDRDAIRAVIRGSAMNNDGSQKPGFSAPGYAGQVRVLREAYAVAGVRAEEISYIETHGTGTLLGDQIEISALTTVFREQAEKTGFCALGSIKANTGHLDAAAGIVGLIRTVLGMERRTIPPCVHFKRANPNLHLDVSPFFVPAKSMSWNGVGGPRKAGVSSFGIGGTNVHLVLQEAPPPTSSPVGRRWHPILLSARSSKALDEATALHADHLTRTTDSLADIAYTLHTGRRAFAHSRMVVAETAAEAGVALVELDRQHVHTGERPTSRPFVAFLFPGGGAQYPGMAEELYRTEAIFRTTIDRCFDISRPLLEFDLREALSPTSPQPDQMSLPSCALPSLFAVEYALAAQWMHWGIRPDAVLGHSLGEYVAACVAGIMSLEDSLRLVISRGELLDQLSSYQMLSIPLSESELSSRMPTGLTITAVNAPSSCVVAGRAGLLEEFEALLLRSGVDATRLKIKTASHCEAVDRILPQFSEAASRVHRKMPVIPCLSNLTGDWIGSDEIADQHYWSRHLRQTVRFADCMARLGQHSRLALVEVGPGRTLGSLARLQLGGGSSSVVVSSLRHALDAEQDGKVMAKSLGRLWMAGLSIDWSNYYADERRRRVPLPTYPFQRRRFWVETQHLEAVGRGTGSLSRNPNASQWFFTPSWKRTWLPRASSGTRRWLIFADRHGVAEGVIAGQGELADNAIVWQGPRFERLGALRYRLNPHNRDDYEQLLTSIIEDGFKPEGIAHFWSIGSSLTGAVETRMTNRRALAMSYYSALYLSQAAARQFPSGRRRLVFFTSFAQEITGADVLHPEQATLHGLCSVIPQEYPNLSCSVVDTEWSPELWTQDQSFGLAQELCSDSDAPRVGYRNGYRWEQTLENVSLRPAAPVFRENGVYLLTGGLGRIGLRIARYLAEAYRARVVLTGRRSWPPTDRSLYEPGEIEAITCAISAVRAAAGEVLVLSADASDLAQMQDAYQAAITRFGIIHGVLHLPSVSRQTSLTPLDDCGPEATESQFRGKVDSAYVLDHLLEGRCLDFCVLFSSLSGMLGGLGLGPYAAASSFLDAFAQWNRFRRSTPWFSIDWEGWKFEPAFDSDSLLHRQGAAFALSSEEGIRAFEQIATSRIPTQLAISTTDLQTRIDQSLSVPSPSPQPVQKPDSPRRDIRRRQPLSNVIEELIAQIWTDHLGVADIKAEHSFFALGGTSLLATYCMARMSESLGVRIPLKTIFEAPKLRDLAILVSEIAKTAPRPGAHAL